MNGKEVGQLYDLTFVLKDELKLRFLLVRPDEEFRSNLEQQAPLELFYD